MIESQKFDTIDEKTEFKKELKKLKKKYRTLPDDISRLIDNQLFLFHKTEIDIQGTVQISDLGELECHVYKTKKFACQSLKGSGSRSGLRLIHAYRPELDMIELIELYTKANKENENRDRIKDYYKVRK